MKVLIVEDEPLAVERLSRLLEEVYPTASVVGITNSIKATLNWLQLRPAPDIILMDIELSDGHSFEIFKQAQVDCPVIFTSSYDEYAIQAFKVNSIDYLLKPIKREELKASLAKFESLKRQFGQQSDRSIVRIEQLIQQLSQPSTSFRSRFLVKQGNRYVSLETEQIAYFYYENKITLIKTWKNEQYLVDFSLDELDQMLQPKLFFRANRQFIVNVKAVADIQDYFNHRLKLTLIPSCSQDLIISRIRVSDFKEWMGK